MITFNVTLHSAWHGRTEVNVRAPNADCAFWVAVYTADPSDRKGYREVSVRVAKGLLYPRRMLFTPIAHPPLHPIDICHTI